MRKSHLSNKKLLSSRRVLLTTFLFLVNTNLKKIVDVLKRSGLDDRFDNNDLTDTQDNTWINFLSGGELRRLEIARAIFKDSDVILF